MDSTHSETRPSNYDSGDEWEIGLGNLIIDLDADLEKDKQDGTTTAKTGDSSPMRIVGKMKIKRKVSSAKGDPPSADLKEAAAACAPSEDVPVQTEQTLAPPAPKGATPSKGGAARKVVAAGSTEGERGDSSSDQKKSNSTGESTVPKTVSVKSVEAPPVKVSKSSEKSSEEGRRKEGGKRSSDGQRKTSGKRPKYEKSSGCSVGVDTMDMGTITEPESLGPCEPGTAVTLEGIVWHENDQGVLVVNVTWRNKTYVGTLLDCSQHNWAPPRFCDSPVSDLENRQTKSSTRNKRGRSSSNNQEKYTETRSSMHSKLRNSTMAKGRRTSNSSSTGRKTPPTSSDRISSSGKRKVKSSSGGDTDVAAAEDSLPCAKRTKSSHKSSNPDPNPEKDSEGLIACPEPNCSKKYKHINGLRYHKVHAHQKPESASPSKERGRDKSEGGNAFKKPREDPTGKEKKQQQHPAAKAEETRSELSKVSADTPGTIAAKATKSSASVFEEEVGESKQDADASSSSHPAVSSDTAKEGTQTGSKNSTTDEGSPKKGSSSPTSSADLSVFDFNPNLEETDTGGTGTKSKLHSPEKSPTLRPCLPIPDSTIGKSEAVVSAIVGDKSAALASLDTESSPDKRLDKEKSKEKHKRREKSVPKPPKSTSRPIVPVPQVITIPISATFIKSGTMVSTQATAVTVASMPPVTTKMTSVIGSNLKPIQPKPTVMGETPLVNPALPSLKDKKQKVKKKRDKMTKDKKERRPEKPSDDPSRAKAAYVPPAIGEMNILKQALTSTVSPIEMLSASLPSQVTTSGPIPSLDQQPVKECTAKDVTKPVASQSIAKAPGVGFLPRSSAPEIPKLISVSQSVSSLPPYSIAAQSLEAGRMSSTDISTSVITRTVQSSLASIPSVPAIEALSIASPPKTVAIPDAKTTSLLDTPTDTSRKTSSPAYSDISDEGPDNQSALFANSKDISGVRLVGNAVNDHLKMSSLSLLRGSPESSELPLKPNITLPLPVGSNNTQKESKPKSSIGQDRTERAGEGVNVPLAYSDHYKSAVLPYFPMDSKHSTLQGLHKNQSPVQQKAFDPKSQHQQGAVELSKNANKSESVTDPMDSNNSLRIHSEHTLPPQRTDTEMHKNVSSGHEKSLYPERTPGPGSSSHPTRQDRDARDSKPKTVEQRRDASRVPEVREDKRDHSTDPSEPRRAEHRSSSIEGDKRPSSRGSKPNRSVSPGYRNSEWGEKHRYSSSPSQSKVARTSHQLQASQNGIPGYTSAGFIHNPYMPYGAIAYDPSHPAFSQSHSPFSPMVAYPALVPGDIPHTTAAPIHWQGSREARERTGHSKESPSASSASLSIPSTSRTSEAHERPTKALDMFAHGNDSYSRHRPRSGSPDRGQRPSSAPKTSSPMTATKSPPRTGGVAPPDPRSELARRQEAAFMLQQQQMLHQHLHTHQHTHLGMAPIGFPAAIGPYDPYVLANHQAAATGVNPFAVRRE